MSFWGHSECRWSRALAYQFEHECLPLDVESWVIHMLYCQSDIKWEFEQLLVSTAALWFCCPLYAFCLPSKRLLWSAVHSTLAVTFSGQLHIKSELRLAADHLRGLCILTSPLFHNPLCVQVLNSNAVLGFCTPRFDSVWFQWAVHVSSCSCSLSILKFCWFCWIDNIYGTAFSGGNHVYCFVFPVACVFPWSEAFCLKGITLGAHSPVPLLAFMFACACFLILFWPFFSLFATAAIRNLVPRVGLCLKSVFILMQFFPRLDCYPWFPSHLLLSPNLEEGARINFRTCIICICGLGWQDRLLIWYSNSS